MTLFSDFSTYNSVISRTRLLDGIPESHYNEVFRYLQASIRRYEKDELILCLGEPVLFSCIVLDGVVEGSFISENYNKININQFETGRSFGEALACVQTPHSPIQLRALTNCAILQLNLCQIFTDAPSDCKYYQTLSKNLIQILASQNVFSNLKLRIANQRVLRDRILMYLHSLVPDTKGYIHVPFTQTALAEFLGVNRSALSRELGNMQDDGLIAIEGKKMKLLHGSM